MRFFSRNVAWLFVLALALLGLSFVPIDPAPVQDWVITYWPIAAAALCWLLAGVWAYYLLDGLEPLLTLIRAVLVLLPIGGLATLLIGALVASEVFPSSEHRTLQALIAGIVVAAGWVTTFVTGEWRRMTMERERRGDMIVATRDEIALIKKFNERADWPGIRQEISDQYRKDSRYQAFIAYGPEYSTLKRLVEQVEILRQDQIEAVKSLYQLLDRIDQTHAAIHSDDFKTLPADRREKTVMRYLSLYESVSVTAEKALSVLSDEPYPGLLTLWSNRRAVRQTL